MKKLLYLILFPLLVNSQSNSNNRATSKNDSTKTGSVKLIKSKKKALELIEGYRQQVISGEKTMSVLAMLYSEDPGSAKEGGFYANVARGVMDSAFEAVAFKLQPGEISKVFETQYGYHFIQLVARRGDLLDLRHILIMPQ
jgi:peptidyl-prolyl cis-trans isomerase SurA